MCVCIYIKEKLLQIITIFNCTSFQNNVDFNILIIKELFMIFFQKVTMWSQEEDNREDMKTLLSRHLCQML